MNNYNEDLKNAMLTLKNGGVILYPTDTIWGLGCDATNFDAVKRIYEIKKREDSKSLLILIDTENRLNSYIEQVPEMAYQLIEYATKPLTIVYPKAKNLATNLLNANRSVGIRITNDEFCKKLIFSLRKPIVSTSANITGEAFPENFYQISPAIIQAVDYVVNWRQDDLTKNQPSSIIRLELNGEIEIIRH